MCQKDALSGWIAKATQIKATTVIDPASLGTATSFPSGNLLLDDGRQHRIPGWPMPPNVDGIDDRDGECFTFFWDRLSFARQRLRYLLAETERALARDCECADQHTVIILAETLRAASDMRTARASTFGWQDIHSDDAELMRRCERLRHLITVQRERDDHPRGEVL